MVQTLPQEEIGGRVSTYDNILLDIPLIKKHMLFKSSKNYFLL